MDLNSIMEFDHPVRVHADGTVTDAGPSFWAPETFVGSDSTGQISVADDRELIESVKRQGWSLFTGYTGQFGYSGPIMHSSEFIGGRLGTDILAEPGVYVSVVISCDESDGSEGVAGWGVAEKEGTTNVANIDDRWWGTIECDDYFLAIDTAVHGGWDVDFDGLVTHVTNCETCRDQDNTVTLDAFGMLTEK
jgi:hypothetical protein